MIDIHVHDGAVHDMHLSWMSGFSDSAGDDGEEETSEEKAVRVRALQRAEISSWFSGAPVEALKRGNVKIWMAEYFFEGYEVDQLTPSEQEEMEVRRDGCDVMVF
ncbi:hypothetical protein Pmar_PMAR026794 [Perkinsus marinus ATCC 50983]|uniref:Uncharacterized protein n=1 Tax=Perkinsus marinus (strain ATCC 50983 / TXsc) TaxID=423536 RepID=C5KFS3_PERM5|nr:hypothetical protein Pmar_PMAR026794 [Perkinsus marinus ATCC 50983]EER16671.1 hypothetical protein Pmar_PMAR026794 [Perkinsus marinus ATCC 50983]|eukprot:XP_002784875.1 hypothetical protein Pmar_PMAR026794 [Perkinsus marinus ATCC 50983]